MSVVIYLSIHLSIWCNWDADLVICQDSIPFLVAPRITEMHQTHGTSVIQGLGPQCSIAVDTGLVNEHVDTGLKTGSGSNKSIKHHQTIWIHGSCGMFMNFLNHRMCLGTRSSNNPVLVPPNSSRNWECISNTAAIKGMEIVLSQALTEIDL